VRPRETIERAFYRTEPAVERQGRPEVDSRDEATKWPRQKEHRQEIDRWLEERPGVHENHSGLKSATKRYNRRTKASAAPTICSVGTALIRSETVEPLEHAADEPEERECHATLVNSMFRTWIG
jgi:hypothetical protein